MMKRIKKESNELYEDLKGVLYRINHLQDSFDNNFNTHSELEGAIKIIINESLKTILADCYLAIETLLDILNTTDEAELIELKDQLKEEQLISG